MTGLHITPVMKVIVDKEFFNLCRKSGADKRQMFKENGSNERRGG